MQVTDNKINLVTAILININVILGAGLFINPAPLANFTGSLCFLNYIIAALILSPIVLSMAKLAKDNPVEGGLYVYSKKYINKAVGFLSGWSYFLGKTTSAALLAHTFVKFFQRRIECLQSINIIVLDFILIFSLIAINILGVRIGGRIQYFFISMKAIPITFGIFTGIMLFNRDFFTPTYEDFVNIFSTLPLAMFVLLSFEMICSIGHMIDKPEKNIKRAILASFIIVASVATIFQLLIYGTMGPDLAKTAEPIFLFMQKLFGENSIYPQIINSFVFASIIGGSFGSLTSNCWNMYALAKDKHFPFSNFFTKVSKTNVPWVSLIIEGLIACILLSITEVQVPLQNMTVFGIVMAYLFSSIAAFFSNSNSKNKISIAISMLAIISSTYVAFLCLKNLIIYGISVPFLSIFLFGIVVARYQSIKNKESY